MNVMKKEATNTVLTVLVISVIICIFSLMSAINNYAPFKGDTNWTGFVWSLGICIVFYFVLIYIKSHYKFTEQSENDALK